MAKISLFCKIPFFSVLNLNLNKALLSYFSFFFYWMVKSEIIVE
jgi:hypothetical protein